MARYIDAETMMDVPEAIYYDLYDLKEFLEHVPTADVVEIPCRCEDCKYYVSNYCTRDVKGRTNMLYMTETDFCSYGENR